MVFRSGWIEVGMVKAQDSPHLDGLQKVTSSPFHEGCGTAQLVTSGLLGSEDHGRPKMSLTVRSWWTQGSVHFHFEIDGCNQT